MLLFCLLSWLGELGSVSGSCVGTDARGVVWSSSGQVQCSSQDPSLAGLEGTASWPCSNVNHFETEQPDRSGCNATELTALSGAKPGDINTTLAYIQNIQRELVGGELIQIVDIIGQAEEISTTLMEIIDAIFKVEGDLCWREVPSSGSKRAQLPENIIIKLRDLVKEDPSAVAPFIGQNFVMEVLKFETNETAIFPSKAGENATRVEVVFKEGAEPGDAAFLGILIQGSIRLTFSNSLENNGEHVSLSTDLIHFSKADNIQKPKLARLKLKFPVIDDSSTKLETLDPSSPEKDPTSHAWPTSTVGLLAKDLVSRLNIPGRNLYSPLRMLESDKRNWSSAITLTEIKPSSLLKMAVLDPKLSCSVLYTDGASGAWNPNACKATVQVNTLECDCNHNLEFESNLAYAALSNREPLITTTSPPTTASTTPSTVTGSSTTAGTTMQQSTTELSQTSSTTVISSGPTTTTATAPSTTQAEHDCVNDTALKVFASIFIALSTICSIAALVFIVTQAKQKLLPKMHWWLVLVLVIAGFISLVIYTLFIFIRSTEYEGCSLQSMLESFQDHKELYTVGGPFLMFFWLIKVTSVLALSLVCSLESLGWKGTYAITGGWVLLLGTVLCPLLVTIVVSFVSERTTDAFLPALTPTFYWEMDDSSLRESFDILKLATLIIFSMMLIFIIINLIILSSFYYIRKDEFSKRLSLKNRIFVRKPFTRTPYIRYAHQLTSVYVLEMVVIWPIFIAGTTSDSLSGRSWWNYVFLIFLFLHHALVLLLNILWLKNIPKKKAASQQKTSNNGGVLQKFVKYKIGKGNERPKGVRGTIRRDEPEGMSNDLKKDENIHQMDASKDLSEPTTNSKPEKQLQPQHHQQKQEHNQRKLQQERKNKSLQKKQHQQHISNVRSKHQQHQLNHAKPQPNQEATRQAKKRQDQRVVLNIDTLHLNSYVYKSQGSSGNMVDYERSGGDRSVQFRTTSSSAGQPRQILYGDLQNPSRGQMSQDDLDDPDSSDYRTGSSQPRLRHEIAQPDDFNAGRPLRSGEISTARYSASSSNILPKYKDMNAERSYTAKYDSSDSDDDADDVVDVDGDERFDINNLRSQRYLSRSPLRSGRRFKY